MRRIGGRREARAQQLPRRRAEWVALLREVGREVISDHATMTAAGLAFYSLLGIIPVLVALSALYGLVADPATVRNMIEGLRGFLPGQATDLLASSLDKKSGGMGLGFGLAVSLGIVLWTAQWAASGLITALNIVFDTPERRSFLGRQLLALVIALGGILFVFIALLVVAVLPAVHAFSTFAVPYPALVAVRWPALALLFMLGLSALYSFAPSRPRPQWKWLSWGAVAATLAWIGLSSAFSAYAASADSFNKLYGSLGGVAIFLFWLYLSGLIILFGAEFEYEVEARRRGGEESEAKRVLKEREKKVKPAPNRGEPNHDKRTSGDFSAF
jgi:membrane protein